MAVDVRLTQHVTEVIAPTVVPIRNTQEVIEVLFPTIIPIYNTQDVIETLADVVAPVRVTQHVIEIIAPPFDMSGVYFINPFKAQWTDTYYGDKTIPNAEPISLKIPDPTIRTALFGE